MSKRARNERNRDPPATHSLPIAMIEIEIQQHLKHYRYEKISNNSSFGIIDIAFESSTSDRIIVIVDTACSIHDGAYR